MKKNLKVMLISGIASILTAAIIFISGGSILIVTLLGGTGIFAIPSLICLNKTNNNINNPSYIKQTDYI